MQVNRSFSGHVYLQAPNLIPSAPFVANAAQTKFEEAYIHMPPCCKLRCSSCPFGLFFHMIPLRHRPGPVVCSFLALSGLCLCLSPAFLLFTELAGLDNIVRLIACRYGQPSAHTAEFHSSYVVRCPQWVWACSYDLWTECSRGDGRCRGRSRCCSDRGDDRLSFRDTASIQRYFPGRDYQQQQRSKGAERGEGGSGFPAPAADSRVDNN